MPQIAIDRGVRSQFFAISEIPAEMLAMADASDLPVDLDPVSHDLVIIAARVHAGSYRGQCSASCAGIARLCR
jgi:hypothetical protein